MCKFFDRRIKDNVILSPLKADEESGGNGMDTPDPSAAFGGFRVTKKVEDGVN